MTAPSPIHDRGAVVTFRTVDDGQQHNYLPALASLLISADQRRRAKEQAQQVDQAGDGAEGQRQ